MREIQGILLFSSPLPLLLLSLFLRILLGPLLSTLFCGCDTWYDVVKRVIDDANRLDFRGADRFLAKDLHELGLTDYTGRPSLSISAVCSRSGCLSTSRGFMLTHFSDFHDIYRKGRGESNSTP